jgi:PAS domain S-box-containing protein
MLNPFSNPSYLLPPLVGLIVSLILFSIVLRGTMRSVSKWLFCLLLLDVGLWNFLTFIMRSSPDVHRALVWDRVLPVAGYIIVLLYYHFTLTYTNTKGQRSILIASYIFIAVIASLAPTGLIIKGMRLEDYGYAPITGPFVFFLSICATSLMVGGGYNLLRRYKASHSYEERNRLIYLVIALLFPFVGGLLDTFSNLPPAAIWGYLIFCILCSVAILRYHLLDIRVVVRKGLVYIIVSSMIAIPYVVILYLLRFIFEPILEQWWIHAIIILLLAILLRPLYSWAQQFVDKLFYRDRYDYLRALEQFSQKAQSVANLKELGSTLTQLVSGALHTSSVCLMLLSESDNGFILVSSTLDSPPPGVVLRNSSLLIKWLKLQQRILSSEEFNIVPQLQSLSLRERNNLEQMEAKLYVPIQTSLGQLSGILVLGQKLSQQPYSSEDRQLLTALSGQMATALENARLYSESQQEVQERKRVEEALKESKELFEKTFTSQRDAIFILDAKNPPAILDCNPAALEMFGYSRQEVLGLGHTTAFLHVDEATLRKFQEYLYPAIEKRGFFHLPEFKMKKKDGTIFPTEHSVAVLKDQGGKPIGWVSVVRDITKRKQAEEQLKQSREQLRNLSAHIESARETERTSIAREVHDELGQALTALKMDLSWLNKRLPKEQEALINKTGEMSKLIGKTIQTVKRISTELRPGVLDDLGLTAAVEWQVQEFQDRTRIKCEFTAKDEDINIDRDLATGIFRIFQEALTNVARHANATKVKVSLKERDGQLLLQVRDNGKGITEGQIAHPKSFGLIGMRERARSWNGNVKIDGISGKGTIVTVSIPLNQKEE